jgi:hypothetical protein
MLLRSFSGLVILLLNIFNYISILSIFWSKHDNSHFIYLKLVTPIIYNMNIIYKTLLVAVVPLL